MSKVKNVVVAIDTSIMANEVLKRAFDFANKDIVLHIVHCIDIPWINKLKEKKDIVLQTKRKLKESIKKLNKENKPFKLIVKKGTPSTVIVKEAKKLDAKLIIIGAYSKENLKTKILGSNAHNIAQKSNLPVLIVKNMFIEKYSSAIAFTDLSKVSKKSIRFTQKFFKDLDIKLVHASKKISEFALDFYKINDQTDFLIKEAKKQKEKEIDKFKKDICINDIEVLEESGSYNEALLSYANKEDKDLVILGSRGVKTASSMLFGSKSSFLMKSVSSDVLVYVPLTK
ncbi:nucleotide-binding universal stress UspA family protein [Malaciobacter marinus]|uniref:Nucleotide-binding universal stress UspA family protein n=1 Tax=Malaciobacter marinus TaxID=505249 RepID=A0AB37A0J9_9BACT|nr:universal stress protein [Malaciobacter marinus]PPK63042.1 nucleotide-binding universal stress UspA family protein [Malaciobacter marinus]SKB75307.1 Nucleotide-binding universal stress protein, UspA family [Malaciobacter marinus]